MNADEYQKAKEGLLAANLSGHAKWSLIGPDRVRYLNGQSTCDVTRVEHGHSSWSAITTIKGKLAGDLRVAAAAESLLLDACPELSESLFLRLSKYIIADDVELSDVSKDWDLYHVLGAEAPSLGTANPVPLVFHSNRFGQPGHDFWLPAGSSSPLPCAGPKTWETLRIESGVPRWGIDMGPDNLAPEMPFERMGGLSYRKGCYIGQEVIARIKSIGHVNKQLCLLHSTKALAPALPTECLSEGKNAGTATSSCPSPGFGGTCLLATLGRSYASEGTQVHIQGESFTVMPLPGA